MTALMIIDYVGCYIIEQVLKRAFSDFRPKDIAVRRPDQIKAEELRLASQKSADLEEQKQIAGNGEA